MKRRSDLLMDYPHIRVIHDKRNDLFKVLLKKSILFELDVFNGNEKLSDLIKEKKLLGKTLRATALKVMEESSKKRFQLKLDSADINKIAETVTQAFMDEHNLELNIKYLCLESPSGSKYFVPIKTLSN